MSDLPELIADDLRHLVRDWDASRARSVQTAVGPSQAGDPCTRCLARTILGRPLTRPGGDPWLMVIGSAVHSMLEEAALHANVEANRARWLTEVHVDPARELLTAGGHVDLFDQDRRTVIDHKVVGLPRLRSFRLSGPPLAYKRQIHIYALGLTLAHKQVEHVALAFWPRGGRLADLYVWSEPFDVTLARDALERYRLVHDLVLQAGAGVLPVLPADPDCYACEGADVDPAEHNPMEEPNREEPNR